MGWACTTPSATRRPPGGSLEPPGALLVARTLQRPGSHRPLESLIAAASPTWPAPHTLINCFSVRGVLVGHLGGQGGVCAPCAFNAHTVATHSGQETARAPCSDLMKSHSGRGNRRRSMKVAAVRQPLTALGAVYKLGMETRKVVLKSQMPLR